jgi:hypothetical protein
MLDLVVDWSICEESHPSDWRGLCGDGGVAPGGVWVLACLSQASLVLWSTGQAAAGSSEEDIANIEGTRGWFVGLDGDGCGALGGEDALI